MKEYLMMESYKKTGIFVFLRYDVLNNDIPAGVYHLAHVGE